MNYLIAFGLFFIAIGALIFDQYREKKDDRGRVISADFMPWLLSYGLLLASFFLGSLFVVGGAVKFIEIEMRGKTMEQVNREYDEIMARSKKAKLAQKQADKIFFDKLIREIF